MEHYLIAHKVRGEPAFDVAIQMEMEDGVWWIIPTSGHRAYPYWSASLEAALQLWDMYVHDSPEAGQPILPMPSDLRDHYEAEAAPKGKGSGTNGRDLLAMLGLVKPIEPMTRRSW
jgi:hypothetical protein